MEGSNYITIIKKSLFEDFDSKLATGILNRQKHFVRFTHCVEADIKFEFRDAKLNTRKSNFLISRAFYKGFFKYINGHISFFFKVHIFWEYHKIFEKIHLYFDWHYILVLLHTKTKIRWRFRKILWPSQNIWTIYEWIYFFRLEFISF